MAPLLEPDKLAQLVVPMFANEPVTGFRLGNGASAQIVLGVADQDDCAAVEVEGRQVLVFGSDYVRGPKFSLYEHGYLSNYDIGWYLAGANLSDVAAMGAQPIGLLSVLRYPKDLPDEDFAAVLQGVRDCCASVGAANLGGDIGTAERMILSASAFGVTEPGGVLARSAARPGQVVLLTGPTGIAGAAMKYLTSTTSIELDESELEVALRPWRRVAPRVSHGRLISRTPGAGACIDTSDGLAGALHQVSAASGVAIEIDQALIPIDSLVSRISTLLGVDVLDLVCGDSVDFELVATIDEGDLDGLMEAATDEGVKFHPIGRVAAGQGVDLVVDGERTTLPGSPWVNAT